MTYNMSVIFDESVRPVWICGERWTSGQEEKRGQWSVRESDGVQGETTTVTGVGRDEEKRGVRRHTYVVTVGTQYFSSV